MFRRLRRIFSLKNILFGLGAFFLSFVLLDLFFPLPPAKPLSTTVLAQDSTLLSAYLSTDDKWRMQTRLEDVSEDLVKAIIAKEDRWFYFHTGINPLAIGRAALSNVFSGKRVSGASTITMQLARMMEPKERTWWNKLVEMFRALQLEWHYSKDEILERYLSYLPYGGNVEGVTTASYIYFDRPPKSLSLAQSTLLTVVPNRPNSLRPDTQSEAAEAARDKWLRRFGEVGVFPAAQIEAALAEPVVARRHEIKPRAPHFSRRMAQENAAAEIRTTLDPEIQATAETLLGNYVRRARFKGITNGAVLVVDNQDASVRAYCGSADYYDGASGGQVDGIRAVRSPGSTLKPILYAMSFDEGIYTPGSRLLDVPATWNGYSPDNYDEKFRGPVSLEYALRHSLNITAVSTLKAVGYEAFVDLLEAAGMETVRKKRSELGLSVILGGCGVTLEELVRTFSAFARGGRMARLRMQADADSLPETRLFSPEAAWLISDILSGIERPDLPNMLIDATDRAKVAWKTGTSYGRRDAWSIGFTPRYTIGVWIGNFDGRGVPDLSGTTMAVPLLFDLFGALEQGSRRKFTRPHAVFQCDVCSETGDIPSEYCRHKVKGYYIQDVSPRKVCDQEHLLYVNADTTQQYCTGCLPQTGYRKVSFPIYPAELTLWYESQGLTYPQPPPHNPACEATFDGPGPQIISPSPDFEYFVQKTMGQEILLQAASDSRVNRHYWYIDGRFHSSTSPGEKVFFAARPGSPKITCMDDKGRSSSVSIRVKVY